ncbi:MAG: DUF4838 domain-containing protein, partial [Phycisphaerae bacterium]|nr:DUF4838 domain-containing protein [Phycisphaerae bacterium]
MIRPTCTLWACLCMSSVAAAASPDWRIVVNFGPYGSAEEAAATYDKVNWFDTDPADETVCTEAFAATELRQYLCKMTGAETADASAFAIVDDDRDISDNAMFVGNIRSNRQVARLAASLDLAESKEIVTGGFQIRSRPAAAGGLVVLAGDDRVGTLYAVYAFLETFGVRWFAPGEVNEEVPHVDPLVIPTLSTRETPAFFTRAFWAWEDRGAEDFFLWMARNRMNLWTVGYHDPASLKRLGMMLTCGGHQHMPKFLNPTHEFPYRQPGFDGNADKPDDPYPRGEGKGDIDGDGKLTYAEAHPEWFGWQDGKRSFKIKNEFGDNFCTSNPSAVAEFTKNLINELAEGQWQWADRIKFFMLDGGRWCTCDACRALGNPNDCNVLLTHQLRQAIVRARESGRLNRDLSIVFSCYTGYLDPPSRPLPADFDYEHCIAGCYVIRRCFAHTFTSPDCTEFNAVVRGKYDGWFLSPTHQYHGPFFVGEYYNISRNKNLPSGFSHSMAVDIPYYYRTGARHMDYMHVPHTNWGTRALTNYQFARMLWKPDLDVSTLRDDYFRKRYGDAAEVMRVFYDRLEYALCNAKMLKYKLSGGLASRSAKLFPMEHLQYEPTQYEHNNAPSLLESVAEMRACRTLIDYALSKDVPDRIRARIQEDADLFAYGEATVHFYNHM